MKRPSAEKALGKLEATAGRHSGYCLSGYEPGECDCGADLDDYHLNALSEILDEARILLTQLKDCAQLEPTSILKEDIEAVLTSLGDDNG